VLTFLAFALPAALFFSHPSCFWNFDGVACASALELGNPLFFFHSNHLLYGFLGFGFWKLVMLFTGPVRALPVLQVFTSLLASVGLAGLYRVLIRIGQDRLIALLSVCAVASTAVVWMWSIEVQVYPLALLGLAWATDALFQNDSPARARNTGLWHALAILGHLATVLWVVPAVYWFWSEPGRTTDKKRRTIITYLLWTGTPVLLAYACVLGRVVLPSHHAWASPWVWLEGSAGLTTDRHWRWHGYGWRGPAIWTMTTLRFFWGSLWPYAQQAVTGKVWGLTALSIGGWVGFLGLSLRSSQKRTLWFCGAWLAAFGLFFWTWEPQTECYRLTDAIPLAVLLALGASYIPQRVIAWSALAVLVISTVAVNATTRIVPMANSDLNAAYAQVRMLEQRTPPNTLYFSSGGPPWIYLLYFTGRNAWNWNSEGGHRFLQHVENEKGRPPIVIQSSAWQDDTTRPLVAGRRWAPVSADLPWLQLQ
jgi:hypothetical protein